MVVVYMDTVMVPYFFTSQSNIVELYIYIYRERERERLHIQIW